MIDVSCIVTGKSSAMEIADGVIRGYNSQLAVAIIISAIVVLGSLVWWSSAYSWFGSPWQELPSSNEGNYPAPPMAQSPGMNGVASRGMMGGCMMGGCIGGNQITENSAPPRNELPEGVEPTVEFVLRTRFNSGGFFYEGVGDEISSIRNPTLEIDSGEVVAIAIINGDGVIHNLVIAGMNIYSKPVGRGESTSVTFIANELGEYAYYCSVPGHREAGMTGRLVIS